MRPSSALRRYDFTPVEIHAVHYTPEGSVYLSITESDENCWVARLQGAEMNRVLIANSRPDAIRENDMTFRMLFQEHRCSGRCVRPGVERLVEESEAVLQAV